MLRSIQLAEVEMKTKELVVQAEIKMEVAVLEIKKMAKNLLLTLRNRDQVTMQ